MIGVDCGVVAVAVAMQTWIMHVCRG